VSNYFGGYFTPTYFARGHFGPLAQVPRIDRGDARPTRIKEWFLERQLREFEEALAALAGDAPQEAAAAALDAFQPIAVKAEGAADIAAVRAISEALHTAMERQKGHASLVRVIETELARIVQMRRRRRDEIAILLLM
jgi:hypothetical protein